MNVLKYNYRHTLLIINDNHLLGLDDVVDDRVEEHTCRMERRKVRDETDVRKQKENKQKMISTHLQYQ
jgi:hypothetical protein